ncbi:MAG: hypothetical protein ACXWEY_12690 [Bacteroidia bacterium]
MRKISYTRLIITLLFLGSFALNANAQYSDSDEEKYPKNVIRFNAGSLILNNYSFFYERAINDKISGQLGGNYMFNDWNVGTSFNGTEYTGTLKNVGFGFTPEIRYYFLNKITNGGFSQPAPYGLYVAGFGRYLRNDFTFNFKANNIDETMKFRTQIFALGGLVGGQAIIAKTVAVDIFIGPDINYASGKITEYPEVKIFEGDEIEWVDTNWITRQLLNYLGTPSISTVFPGVRAGVTAGIAF